MSAGPDRICGDIWHVVRALSCCDVWLDRAPVEVLIEWGLESTTQVVCSISAVRRATVSVWSTLLRRNFRDICRLRGRR